MTETTKPEQDLSQLVDVAAKALGYQMETILPFVKSGWLLRKLGAVQFSEMAIMANHPAKYEKLGAESYTRAWLERPAAKTEQLSTIELLTDIVDVDPDRFSQAHQFSTDKKTVATYNTIEGLHLMQKLATAPEATLARIVELGGYVMAIDEAKLHKQLRKAVDGHDLKLK